VLAVQSPRARAPRRAFAVLASAVALAIGFSGLAAVTTLDSAAAAASNPLAPLQKFTVLARENATVPDRGEFEGSLAVGGNLSFQNYNLSANKDGSSLPSVDGLANVQLFVGGTVQFPGNGKFDVNSGIARITDTTGMQVSADKRLYKASMNAYLKSQGGTQSTASGSGPSSYTANPGAFAAAFPASAFATLESTSESLAGLTAGSTVAMVTTNSATPERTITLTSGKINVWNVSASTLAGLTAVNFANNVKPSATTPLIINVADDAGGTVKSVRLNVNDVTLSKYILWNFAGWQKVTVTDNGAFYGSVLAPEAVFSYQNNSELNGQIAVKSFAITTGAEIHHYGFSYDTPEKTTVAGSWSTTGACASPSNQLVVDAATGVTYTWTKGKSGSFTSFSQSGLVGTYAFTVSVTDPALYTLGANPSSFEVTFEAPHDCEPTLLCIPPSQVTYTYDAATNSGTVTVPAPHGAYGDTLCQPFWVSAVSWTYITSGLWPQRLVHDNPMPNDDGGFRIEKSGEYHYGAPVVCGQGDIYASFLDQRTTSPSLQGYTQLDAPSTPFPEYFLHGMGFSGPNPTYMQTALDCNKVTPEHPVPSVIPAGSCDVDGSLTVGSGDTTAVLSSANKVATIEGVVYTLTEGDGTSGTWKVVATPATGKYFAGPSQVKTYRGDLGARLECDSVDKPALQVAVCDTETGLVTDAYIVIPAGTNFTFSHNGVVKNPGARVDLPAGVTTTIDVAAKPGFKNVGAASFDYTPEQIDCDGPVEYVTPRFTTEVCVDAPGDAAHAELEFTATEHLAYFVDGVEVVFPAGETTVKVAVQPGTHVVTVVADAGYYVAGTADQTTKDYEVVAGPASDCDEETVIPLDPFATPQECQLDTETGEGYAGGGSITIVYAEHVTWQISDDRDGIKKPVVVAAPSSVFPYPAGDYHVWATADPGYYLTTPTSFPVKVAAPLLPCDLDTHAELPTKATWTHQVCSPSGLVNPTITVEPFPGVSYFINGTRVTQSTTTVAPGTYTITAVADDPENTVTESSWGPVTLAAVSNAALCGDLTTLALTGETPGGWLLLALILLQAGLALVAVRLVRMRRGRHLAR
jgi:hypothetical protein